GIVAGVEGEDIGARAAEAGVVNAVVANRQVDAVVFVDLPAQGAADAAPRPRGVQFLLAAAHLVVVLAATRHAEVPVERLVDAAALGLAVDQVPHAGVDLDQVAGRGPAGLHDDVDHAAHVLAAVNDGGGTAHD